jgi:hypothetical protein
LKIPRHVCAASLPRKSAQPLLRTRIRRPQLIAHHPRERGAFARSVEQIQLRFIFVRCARCEKLLSKFFLNRFDLLAFFHNADTPASR